MPRSPDLVPLPGSEPAHRPGAAAGKAVVGSRRAQVTVVLEPEPLPPDHPVAVKARAQDLLGAAAPPLTLEELADLEAPPPRAVEEVLRFAAVHRLKVLEVSRLRRDVVLEGSAADLGRAFAVTQREYRDAEGSYQAYGGPLSIDPRWAGAVTGILGLDTLPHYAPQTAPAPHTAVAPAAPVLHQPAELAEHYRFPDASGLPHGRVALLESGGGYHPEDVGAYLAERGLPAAELRDVSIPDGAGGVPGNTPLAAEQLHLVHKLWRGGTPRETLVRVCGKPTVEELEATLEVTMDVEIVAAMAPGAPVDVVFASPTADGWRRALYALLGAPYPGTPAASGRGGAPPVALSISWGKAEQSWGSMKLRVLHGALDALGRRGVTVCCSSGDFGAHNTPEPARLRHVNFPASSPAVLACGGTTLVAQGGEISGERAWKQILGGQPLASGGGMSGFFPTPAYQSRLELPAAAGTWRAPGLGEDFRGRWLPDVAANADFTSAVALRLAGQEVVGGGTSAATPIWAALVARLAACLGRPLGGLNPTLYRLAEGTALADVTHGDSHPPVLGLGPEGWEAGPGWDPVTGLGTPMGRALLEALSEVMREG
jgi:kumamolisin